MYEHTVGDPTEALQTLSRELETLRPALAAAFSRNMKDRLTELEEKDAQTSGDKPLGRLQGAKLAVSAAYVYLDLLWMHLKATGVDPTTHPVHTELQRVHAYFTKLREAEPDARPLHVDKDAAKRMVAASISGKHTRFDNDDADKKAKKAKKPKKDKKNSKAA
ncbi:hypothetical protein MCUN1_000387 [Malassezia cuniculi]|uniref:Exosome complex protein n=1 Tax=Malassezia cuniculi TaxID=948313 RepID=A0AAF0ER25_9BASI|nr:hypothetical protein MCUN1_000387 [Malassezia cuniculi]